MSHAADAASRDHAARPMRFPAPLRNVLIVAVLAAAVVVLPGGGAGADTFGNVLNFLFFAGAAFFAYRLYMEHRLTLYGLGERDRAILYASAGVLLLAGTATSRLWDTGAGILVWFLLIGAAVGATATVVSAHRRY